MKTIAIFSLITFTFLTGCTTVTEDPKAKVKAAEEEISPSTLLVNFSFDAAPPANVEIRLYNSETREKTNITVGSDSTEIDLSGINDGKCTISFSAPGYAYQWYRGNIYDGRFSPKSLQVDFKKKRFVVMRYTINLDAEPSFKSGNLYTGEAAFSDLSYGNPQYFLGWRLRQAELGEKAYGREFITQWKWMIPNTGLCVREESFDEIESATEDTFRLKQVKLEKGLVFTCKSSYSRNPGLYGKFEVIDVIDAPSDEMEVY